MNELDVEIVVAAAQRARRRRAPESPVADAVASTGELVVASSPAVARGAGYTAASQALGGMAHHAATLQADAYQLLHTSTTLGVDMVYESSGSCSSCSGGNGDRCHCHDPGKRRKPVAARPRRRARRR